jgi:Helix-turn-helix domain
MSKASGSSYDAMGDDHDEFWSALPEKVQHPVRVPIIEALWWTGQPLSAIALVDLFDGQMSMWEAAHHLGVLEELGVVEALDSHSARNDQLDLPYGLKDPDTGDSD